MKKWLVFITLQLLVMPISLVAQSNQVLVPYLSSGYLYQFVKTYSNTFPFPGTKDDDWSLGKAAFGTLNNTSSPPCPLNDASHIHVTWPSSRDILLRKHLFLTQKVSGLKIIVQIDNAVQAFFNGIDVSNGIQTHNTCATADGDFTFSVPDSLVRIGDNVIALHGVWRSAKSYIDMQVIGNTSSTIIASAGAGGSISPSGTIQAPQGGSQSFAILANSGFHVQSIMIDGVTTVVATSLTTPATYNYTFSNVTANHTISAAFSINTYIISASADPNGSIAPTGSDSVAYGGNVSFSITANTGYHVQSITIDGVTATIAASLTTPASYNYTFSTVAMNHTISASFGINIYIVSPSADANGIITPAGSDSVAYGGNASFLVSANTGYHVQSITIDGVTTPVATSLTMPATYNYTFSTVTVNHTISVSCSINLYFITATAGPHGDITPAGADTVPYGGTATFIATADSGNRVQSVTIDSVTTIVATSLTTPNIYSYTFSGVTSNHSVSAAFGANIYVITAGAGPHGTIFPTGMDSVVFGGTATFFLTADTGYHVRSAAIDTVTTSTATSLKTPGTYSYTFSNVAANHVIAGAFGINLYVIATAAGAHGSITPPGPDTTAYGGTAAFTVKADSFYHVTSLTVDTLAPANIETSPSTPAQLNYSFTSVSSDHTLGAAFGGDQFSQTIAIGTDSTVGNQNLGNVVVNPRAPLYAPQTLVTDTAFANPGYHFVSWLFPDSSRPVINPISVTMDQNKIIKAIFAQNVPLHIVVNTLLDTTNPNDGLTSLREAIAMVNSNAGSDSITFDITAGNTPGSKLIMLSRPLPSFTDQVTLDFSALVDGNGKPLITLQPGYSPQAYPNSDGIDLGGKFLPFGYTPKGSIIRGLQVMGFPGAGICMTSEGNVIQRCIINGNGGNGICIEDGNNNRIGDTAAANGNTIYGNGQNGVAVIDVIPGDGIPPPSGNSIIGNSIYSNSELGIDLGGDGKPNPNVYPGGPTNPLVRPVTPAAINFAANYPAIDIATVGGAQQSQVGGYLLSWRNTTFRIEVFVNDSLNPLGNGEGKTLIGTATVTTDADSAYAWFAINSSVPLQFGQFVSATATDQYGNTSEFSPGLPVGLNQRIFQSDQYIVNTTFSGIPLHWPDGIAAYNLANSVIAGGFRSQVEHAFTAWNVQALKPDSTSLLHYTEKTPLAATEQWGGYPDGVNNVVWVTSNWDSITGAPEAAIAITRVRYNAFNGEMTDVDVAFNAQFFQFGDADAPGYPGGLKDVLNAGTHEVGHFGGLGDMYVPGYPGWDIRMGANGENLTMYGIIRDDETSKRTLEPGDIAGMNYIYGHVPPDALDLVLVIDASASFNGQYNGVAPSINSATELVNKLRANDRIAVVKLPDSIIVPLTKIDSTNIGNVISRINGITIGGTQSVGTGLQTALNVMQVSDPKRRAMILYSNCEETGTPGALSMVPPLNSASVTLFSFGFSGSPGQNLASNLAQQTFGAYYLAADTTIPLATDEIWDELTGLQLVADTGIYSGQTGLKWQGGLTWQGGLKWQGGLNWQGGLKWQGAIDPGTTTTLPGLKWQGSQFVLFLIPPGFPIPTGTTDSITTPSYVIRPDHLPPGAKYIEGPTYAFYQIPNPAPGQWTLIPIGANTTPPPVNAELVKMRVFSTIDVVFNVSFSKTTYQPGETVTLQATLSEGGSVVGTDHVSGGKPITDATVNANVVIPGSSTPQTLTLQHIGNGVYQGVFTQTATIGTYNFTVFATGTTITLPQPFTRQATQSVFVTPVYADAVVFGQDSVNFKDTTKVLSGSVMVNNPPRAGARSGALLIGTKVTTPSQFNLKADHITIGSKSTIGSSVYYNRISNAGAITGTLHSPLILPLGGFPAFLQADSAVLKAQNYTLAKNKTDTLKPGTYGAVYLDLSSRLILLPGVYNWKSFWMEDYAQLLYYGNQKIQIKVLRGFATDNNAIIGPAAGSALTASGVVIYVAATDAQSGFATAVNFSPPTSIAANIVAPNGTIYFGQKSIGMGAFFGKVILTDKSVTLGLASAFGGSATQLVPGVTAASGDAESPQAATVKTYQLMQNYPNPFNPTTMIRYAVPENSHVVMTIFDVLGRTIARLVDADVQAGIHQVLWDGRNRSGQQVGSGIYFYQIISPNFRDVKKMMVIR